MFFLAVNYLWFAVILALWIILDVLQKTSAAKKVLSFSCWTQKVTSRQTDATDTTVDKIARYLWFDSVVVWGTRDPTAICATMLISGSMGMYSNAITDNYSLRHVCCLTYEFVHVCKCVCVWLASVVLISHQSSWCQTDWLSDNKTTLINCVHVSICKEFLSKAFCLFLVF